VDLKENKCLPCEAGVKPYAGKEAQDMLKNLDNWEIDAETKKISKLFQFKNYYHTMAFVNAIAWISHRENHHPDLIVSYNKCLVEYTTHAIDGLSKNDFICAAKVDAVIGATA
jgi:4a-hydroxytetrahydrobiopterin dehydratase